MLPHLKIMIPSSLLHIEAGKHIISDLFASTFVYKTVSSTDNKRRQQNDLDDKNFPFHPNVSSRSTRPKTGTGMPSNPGLTLIENRLHVWKRNQNFSHRPQHSSNPLQAPPARLFTSSPPPCWLAGWQRVGGTSILGLVPFNLLPTSCIVSVLHQDEGAWVHICHFHCPPVVMMIWVEFQYWFVFIFCVLFVRCSPPLVNPFRPDSPKYLQISSPHSSHTRE